MATRLRNFSTNSVTKCIAFILIVISITSVVLQIQYLQFQKNIKAESLFVKEYKDSNDFLTNYVYNTIQDVSFVRTVNFKMPNSIHFIYYFNDGDKTYTNTKFSDKAPKAYFEQYNSSFYAFENGVWSAGKNTNPEPILYHWFQGDGNIDKYTVYIAFTDEFMLGKQKEWKKSREKMVSVATNMISSTILIFLLIGYLFCFAGRRKQDKELHLSKIDKIYSDILLTSFILIVLSWIVLIVGSIHPGGYLDTEKKYDQILYMIWVGSVTSALSVILGTLSMSLVRKIKARILLKHSLIFTLLFNSYDFLKSIFDGRRFEKYPLTKSLFYRQLVFIIVSAVLVVFTFMFFVFTFMYIIKPPLYLVPPVLEIIIIYWYVKGNNKTFADINKGFNESLEEQMRAERMKIALVTNVSHDLKTPLTSIISYVDLLSKEGDLSDTASDYVKILSEKSNRLKNIVSDLFDLAKSSSGSIALDLESIDMKKLIEQTLADMEDEIAKSGLQIKTKLPDSPIHILSDGKKLYRVFQNVVDNALKYSLGGTRVFVELGENSGKVAVTIKNTAGYEMDFTPDEILQRFNRGDKSRTTEGSGLGLSIAESFTNACGGSFKLDIDGDLFKVTITL